MMRLHTPLLNLFYKSLMTGAAVTVLTSFASGASAQDAAMQVGDATVSVGAGAAILDLPDVQFFKKIPSLVSGETVSGRFTTADDFSNEIGLNINGAITAPVGGLRAISLSSFWAHIEGDDNTRCTSVTGSICVVNALVQNPATLLLSGAIPGASFNISTEREVDQAGIALEVRQLLRPGIMDVTKAPDALYVALGADWRAINQDMTVRATQPGFTGFNMRYTEELDTDYYGVFAAYGGGYAPFLFNGLQKRWGLQSSFRLQGGVYYADTDYSGKLRETSFVGGILNSDATDSNNEIAFIGGLTLETRMPVGRRATLSLKNEFEYYSYVPGMKYNDNVNGAVQFGPNAGTTIGDKDAYAMRANLQLTIKLGPDEIMEPQ